MKVDVTYNEVRLLAHAAFSDVAEQLTDSNLDIHRLRPALARGQELLDMLDQMKAIERAQRAVRRDRPISHHEIAWMGV